MFLAWSLGTGIEKIFWGATIAGGALFVIRLVMMFVGGLDHDADAGGAGGLEGHDGDSDSSFTLLSLQSVSAFFMMFGLVGLAIFKGVDDGAVWAVVGGAVAGSVAVWVIGKILSVMRSLQSSGTLDIANAVGAQGTVYLNIPAEGTGKVQITIQERLQEFNAISEDKEDLKTGRAIVVARVVGGTVLAVRKA